MYTIVTTPNSLLLEDSKEVKKIDAKILDLLKKMAATLEATTDPKGVGLAAPQVGVHLRIFLVKPTDKSKVMVFINPVIHEDENNKFENTEKEKSDKKGKSLLEGCLSIPTIWGKVRRKKEINVTYMDEHGRKITKVFKGFIATIIQHEIDHLNGVLFTKRAMEQNQKLYKSYKNDEGEEEFEEIKV